MTHKERRQVRATLAQLLSKGAQVADLCEQFNVSGHTVHRAAEEFGVEVRTDVHTNDLGVNTYNIIADLVMTDLSLSVLATRYKVSRQRVSQILHRCKQAGIPVHAERAN